MMQCSDKIISHGNTQSPVRLLFFRNFSYALPLLSAHSMWSSGMLVYGCGVIVWGKIYLDIGVLRQSLHQGVLVCDSWIFIIK